MTLSYPVWICSALLILSGCRGGSKSAEAARLRPLNVVLITIDTLRPDRLGCYGYSNIETPNLDRLAQNGVQFENAVAQAPLTAPSHASIMTGLNPPAHKVRDTGGFVLPPSSVTLASILQAQGWETAAFVGASVLKKRFGLNLGFSVYDDDLKSSPSGEERAERPAAEVVDRAVQWLDSQSGRPFLLWVHVFDPHLPYNPPSPFREKYAGRPYDGEVAYADQQLGRLLAAVAKKSPPAKTVVVAMSDHGESFSEHREYAHGVFLYDTTLRIAWLMSGPGVPAGVRIRRQARSIDLLPTLLDLLGGAAPHEIQGVSLVPAFKGKETPAYAYAETLFPRLNMGWAELRGVRSNQWKYIRAPRPELYDLTRDPGETNNVVASHPTEVRELERQLTTMAGSAANEKVQPAPVDPRTLQQLKSLGYLGGSEPRQYTLNGQGVDPKDRTEVLKALHFGVQWDLPVAQRIAMLRKAVAQDPLNPSLYSNLGDVYAHAGRDREAAALYQEALAKGIRQAWLFSRLGHLRLREGKREDAIPLFEAAAQQNPSDYESLQNLAVAYRETGRVADAEAILNLIVKSGEEFAPAYNELGMVWYQKGDINAARGYFEKAARLDPTYQLNLGRLYKMTGENARARASFEAFLAARGATPQYRQMTAEAEKELATLP